jgi:sugar phosphate isomerase/epimerase
MKLAISNLSWDYNNLDSILNTIKSEGFSYLELALTKIHDWEMFNYENTNNAHNKIEEFKLNVASIQSIFYKTSIDSLDETEKIISHLQTIISISKLLKFDKVVFGSPKIRKVTSLDSLKNLFHLIDDLFDKNDLYFLIEPNSKHYGGDFFFELSEIVGFLKENNFKKIRTMIDTHNSFLENSNPIDDIINYFEYVEHIHISENNLNPLENLNFHKEFSNLLFNKGYDKIITYELMNSVNFQDEIKTFYKIYNK